MKITDLGAMKITDLSENGVQKWGLSTASSAHPFDKVVMNGKSRLRLYYLNAYIGIIKPEKTREALAMMHELGIKVIDSRVKS